MWTRGIICATFSHLTNQSCLNLCAMALYSVSEYSEPSTKPNESALLQPLQYQGKGGGDMRKAGIMQAQWKADQHTHPHMHVSS